MNGLDLANDNKVNATTKHRCYQLTVVIKGFWLSSNWEVPKLLVANKETDAITQKDVLS